MWLRMGNTYVRDSEVLQFDILKPTHKGVTVGVTITATVHYFDFQSERTASFFVEQIIKAINTKEGEVYDYRGSNATYVADKNFVYVDTIYECVREECGEVADAT